MGGKAKHFAFYCAEGEGGFLTFLIDLTVLLLSNLDVNVLAMALTSRLQIVMCVPPPRPENYTSR